MKRSFDTLLDRQPLREGPAELLEDDPRWQLAQQVVSGAHFSKSPLLSKFLLYVVRETLEGRQAEIGEHQIGVSVSADLQTIGLTRTISSATMRAN